MCRSEQTSHSGRRVRRARTRGLAGLVASLIGLSSAPMAGAQPKDVATPPAAKAPVAPSVGVATPGSDLAGLMDSFDYDPRGRRDPFAEPIPDKPVPQGVDHGPALPLQRFELAQLRLVGIIWDVRKPKAMIKDPAGNTHIVGPNTKLGPRNGYIAVIREGEIVVVETIDQEGRLISTAQVVKIAK